MAFSTTALDKKVGFMLKVLEHILMTQPMEYPNASAYTEAVKELQAESAYELQRLAGKMPDQLLVSLFKIIKICLLIQARRMSMINSKQRSMKLFPPEILIRNVRHLIKLSYSQSCMLFHTTKPEISY